MFAKKIVIITVSLFAVFTSGCATLQNTLNLRKPTASLQGVKFQDITLKSADLIFDLEVENPYPVALPLLNLDYSLARFDEPFLSGKADLQTTIPAHSTQSALLPVKISYLDLYQAFKDIRPGSIIPYHADLGLAVDTPALGTLRLPIKKDGNLSVPTIPEISDLDWKDMLLEKITK